MKGESFEWGWLNVSGVRGDLEEIVHFMDHHDFSFLVLGETWLKPAEILRHPSIVFDLRFPSQDPSKGRGIHGLMVVRNPKLTDYSDFEEVKRDTVTHSYIWFKFRGMVIGGFYLPPSMELTTCVECILSASELPGGLENGCPVFMVGDLNMRLGRLTGDTVVNLRSNIKYTLQDLGLSWIRPDSGKWTFHTSRGRSMVDYVFANREARKLASSTKIWEDDFIGGSDHRLLSCVTIERSPSIPTILSGAGGISLPCNICRIRREDIKNPLLRTAVIKEMKAGRKDAKDAVIASLGPLLSPRHVSRRTEVQRKLDTANSLVLDYIRESLAKGGLTPKPVRPAFSKPLWDHKLSLIKMERNRHLKAAKSHPPGSAVAVFLEDEARLAQKRLRKEVRRRKRTGFISFTECVASKSLPEAMRQMSSIRRRHQNPKCAPGPGLSVDRLDTYADHFSEVFSSHVWKEPADSERIKVVKDAGFTYQQLSQAIRSMPNNKASGLDRITAEILKLGGQSLVSVMYPLYKAVRACGMVPSDWNSAALQLIWKGKGCRDDIETYRPIALTSIFRKVLERTIMGQLQIFERRLDIAQGGFRKGKNTYDLVLALDMIIRDCSRKKKSCWQAFLDIKGAYDNVDRDILWRRCRRIGIKGGLYKLLRCLFDHASVVVRIGGRMSRKVIMGRGLLQGSLVSPSLFNIFIDTLPRLLRRRHPSFSLGDSRINSLLYADDIVLVSSTKDQLQSMLNTCELHSRENGYVFSPPKCEIVVPSDERAPCFMLYGEYVRLAPSFKYLGIPVTEKGIDIAGLCYESISRAVKTVNLFHNMGCNGSGFPLAVNRWIMTSFVRTQMEYGLGLTYLGTSLENTLDKAWSRMWRRVISLLHTTSGLAILKMMGVTDMAFRARKLNTMMLMRAHKADPDTLTNIVYRHATRGAGRKTRKSLLVRSRRNPILRNDPAMNWDWAKEERIHMQERQEKTRSIVARHIEKTRNKIDTFLRRMPRVPNLRDVRRKLVLWRTGVLPGKPQICQGCELSRRSSREHLVECSGLKETLDVYVSSGKLNGQNMLDAALNDTRIWKYPQVWNEVKRGLQTVWRKCLGRTWHSSHERSPVAEQKVSS